MHTFFWWNSKYKDFCPNDIKIDENSNKNVLVYYIAYVTIKFSKFLKINSVNLLYLVLNKMNGYFEEINGNNYLALVLTNESNGKIKKYEELWIKISYLIRLVTRKSDDYDKKNCIKIKLDPDDKLPLNKTIKTPVMVMVVRAVFLWK